MKRLHKDARTKKPPYTLMVVTATGITVAVTSGEALLGIRGAGVLPNNVLLPMFIIAGVVAVIGGVMCVQEVRRIKNFSK